jgi:hypothetical protein
MIEGALILLAGAVLGAILARLPARRKGPRPAEAPKPVCGCHHHHSYHDPETGRCNALVNGQPVKFDKFEDPIKWEQVPCACLRYSGPEPMPTYYAPEIAGEAGQ